VAPAPLHEQGVRVPRDRQRHWYWLAAGLALFFLIPFLFTDLMPVRRDVYYGIYVVSVFAFFGAWVKHTGEARALLTRRWLWGLVLGVLFAGVMTAVVLREAATPHPHGASLIAAIVWRGVVYGFADGLILSAFPILAVVAALGPARGWRRKAAIGAVAMAASLVFTAAYHVGYADFRGEKIRKPLAGDLIWSVPTLATSSPLAAPLAHAGMHITAVIHSYETSTFLPPHESTLDVEALKRIVADAVAGPNRLAPGATAYVATRRGSWSGSAGFADVANATPMPADARMRLESISKIWTATLVYQLADEGKLRLSDTVAHWLPNVLPYGNRITVAELLSHTSGLIDNNDVVRSPATFINRVTDPAFKHELIALRERIRPQRAIEFSPWIWIRLAAYQPLVSEPGATYHYSNIGFEILGVIAERASGEQLSNLYREHIFAPLGLTKTAYDPQGPIGGEHAHGYSNRPLRDTTDFHPGVGAEGGIVSTAADTAKFLLGLMRGRLLGPAALEALEHGFWSGGEATGCGDLAYGHSGGGYGFKTNAWVSEDGRRVAVLLLNGRGNASADAGAARLMARLYCTAGRNDS